MALFVSTFTNKIDQKGRVSFPAPFRATLADQTIPGFAVYPSFTATALEGCGNDLLERMAASAESSFDMFSAEQDDLATLVFSSAQQIQWDGDGRVVLPQDLLTHAGIRDRATFVGKGRTFQIWEPDTFSSHLAGARARALQSRPRLSLNGGGAA